MAAERVTDMRYSHSSLAMYKACPLKYHYHYNCHLQPQTPGSQHDLDFGSAMHAGIQQLYTPDGTVAKAREAFAAAYPESGYPATLPYWSPGKSFQNGLAAIGGYAQHWREDDRYWEVLEVEKLESVNDDEDEKVLRLDLIVRDIRDGQVYGVDTKTTGRYLDSGYWTGFEPHSQVRMYAQHIRERYGECAGFIINAISLRHRSKGVTPYKGPNKGVFLPAGDWYEFKRMTFTPNVDCLQLEQTNIQYWLDRVRVDQERDTWGYNTDSCHKGGVECQYHALCSAGYSWPQDDELILSLYRQVCLATIEAGKCQLDQDHDGDHSPVRSPQPDFTVELDDEIEEAIS